MTVYEIIQQKEQQVERLTREIDALRTAARMLQETQSTELEAVPASSATRAIKSEEKTLRQFP
jgi:hypothetical protein